MWQTATENCIVNSCKKQIVWYANVSLINKSDKFCTLSIDYVPSICHLKSKLCNLYTTHLPSSPRQLTNT